MRYCCSSCFISDYISQVIVSANLRGSCEFCHTRDTFIYEAHELSLFFKSILELYEVNDDGSYLEDRLITDFPLKIFSEHLIKSNNIKILIEKILGEEVVLYEGVLHKKVRLKINKGADVEFLSLSWDNFSEEIIHQNRFHLKNIPDIERLKSLFKNYQKRISINSLFYRARIARNSQGYKSEEMGSPPAGLATSGRANPEGISYLYVANNLYTTLHEVRANLLDYVCVGEFVTNEDLNIINLSNRTYDIFSLAESETLEEVLVHKDFIDKLENQLAVPRRNSDSKLDYLPTQYLSELIKSMGYDGIEYKSSLSNDGDNLVVFYPDKLRCRVTRMIDVTDIDLRYKEL